MGSYALNIIIGLLLIIFGILFILDQADAINFRFWNFVGDIWPIALIIIGLYMIYEQTRKEKRFRAHTSEMTGTKSLGGIDVKPDEIDTKGAEYKVGFGDLRIDLSTTSFALGEQYIEASVAFGDLRIILPRVTSVKIRCNCGIGDISLFGERKSGMAISREYADPEFDNKQTRVKILAKCAMGDIHIERPEKEI